MTPAVDAKVPEQVDTLETPPMQPPRDGLVRALAPQDIELRDDEAETMPRLTGYMMRFDEWTDIDSIFEGHFKERIKPGAATRTLKQNAANLRILFNHGHDPSVGEKPLAPARFMEDSRGVRYDDPVLFDAAYVRELVPPLRAGEFGSSFKFRVVQESINEEPEPSTENPQGIPERTITELRLYEGGPVTFPAYEGSSAGARCRSLTDHFFLEALRLDPSRAHELDELFKVWVARNPTRVRELLATLNGEPAAGSSWAALADLMAGQLDKADPARQDGDASQSDDASAGPDSENHSAAAREDDTTTPELYGVPSNSQRPAWLLNV